MKKYYVYVANVGIIKRVFDTHETAQDILCTLINDYGLALMGYDDDLLKIQQLFLDSILYETYKL